MNIHLMGCTSIPKWILFLFFISPVCSLKAQSTHNATLSLSLEEAIRQAKAANRAISALKKERRRRPGRSAGCQDGRPAPRTGKCILPALYQRNAFLTGCWAIRTRYPKPPGPDAGALALEASMNLYAGGRQKAMVTDMQHKSELATLDTREQASSIALQVTLQYLDMIRLYFQARLIKDQVTRARIRSKNINAFYINGKVTKSDVLRADVSLSNILLNETANDNDYRISNRKLNMLLHLDQSTTIIPADTVSLIRPDSLELERLSADLSGAYAVLKLKKHITLQENRTKLARSFQLPSLSLFGGYGFNYPNTLVFPPRPQTFAVGTAGVRLTYELSSRYQHKNKVRASRLRESRLQQQQEWISENVQQEATALNIKYNEALNRAAVTKKSIEQAATNYQIQHTKYANQLSLLTDLLEADNLYQESRLNHIQANIAALSLYYRLLFLTGKL